MIGRIQNNDPGRDVRYQETDNKLTQMIDETDKKMLSYIARLYQAIHGEKLDFEKIQNAVDALQQFNAKNDMGIINKEKNEEEILCEFLDCFDLNYNLLISKENQEDNDNTVNFEEFANFYEYVSFLYDKDDDFIQLINNSWKIN